MIGAKSNGDIPLSDQTCAAKLKEIRLRQTRGSLQPKKPANIQDAKLKKEDCQQTQLAHLQESERNFAYLLNWFLQKKLHVINKARTKTCLAITKIIFPLSNKSIVITHLKNLTLIFEQGFTPESQCLWIIKTNGIHWVNNQPGIWTMAFDYLDGW